MADEQRTPYDISAHVGKIRTKQGMQPYLAVKWRVLWLRHDHPGASIVTEKVDGGIESGWVEFKCTITLPDGSVATDYGSETRDDFPDYYEKAATKATGRALALLGYGTDAAPDLDEGEPLDGAAASKDERANRRIEAQHQENEYARVSRATSPAPDGGMAMDRVRAVAGADTLTVRGDGPPRFTTEVLVKRLNDTYGWHIADGTRIAGFIDDLHAEYSTGADDLVPFDTDKEGKQTRFPSTIWRWVEEHEQARKESAVPAI